MSDRGEPPMAHMPPRKRGPANVTYAPRQDDGHVRLRVPKGLAEVLKVYATSRRRSRNAAGIDLLIAALAHHGMQSELAERGLLPDPTLDLEDGQMAS